MAEIKATPYYAGKALTKFAETLQVTDDLPADAIGEVAPGLC